MTMSISAMASTPLVAAGRLLTFDDCVSSNAWAQASSEPT